MDPPVSSIGQTNSQTLRVIRNFLDNAYSHQFDPLLNDEFERLKQLTNNIRLFKMKSSYEGEKEINRKKNRYRDIVPYDESRVILNSINSDDDYINASFVRSVLDDHYKYIAAQGPSKETIIDFIRMLVQFQIKIVICACNEYEGQKLKCFRYWTDNENLQLNKNYYICLKSKPVMHDGLIIRELVVRSVKSSTSDILKDYEFTQIHITNWPDHGVPNKLDSIMNTLKIVRHKLLDKENSKLNLEYIAVHCSAGCGRTGTIIAIDQVWTLLKENKLNDEFSLFKIAYALREQRIAMIQTFSQYQLFAKAVVYLFEQELNNQNMKHNTINNSNNSKQFPVRSTHSNYDNLSNLAYQKINQASVIRPTTPSDFKQNDDDQFLIPVYTSQNGRRLNVDSNNNNINELNTTTTINNDKPIMTPKSPSISSRSTIKSSDSTSTKQKSSRFTPNSLFNIFTPSQSKSSDKSSKSSASNFPLFNSTTPSTSASPVPSLPDKLSTPYENNTKKDESLSITSNVSSIYLSLNPKSNLTRSLMVTPSSKTYLTSKSIQIDSTQNSNSNYINLKQITNNTSTTDSTTSSVSSTNGLVSPSSQNLPKQYSSKTTSPQFPRKLFNDSNPSSGGDTFLNMSYSESNNESLSTTSSRNNNNNSSHNHQSELYLNDASLNKKEPGSVCEFLSNKLEINRQNLTKSTVEQQINSAGQTTTTTINNLTSLSTMSDSNITPATYAIKSSKNFVLSNNQPKMGTVKHTDLRQINPPLKAELYDSLPKANFDTTTNQLEELDQPPKPPARRIKKASKSIDEDDKSNEQNLKQTDPKRAANFSIKYDKNPYVNNIKSNETNTKTYTTQLNIQQPNESGVIFRSSRSNSSTYYDNHIDQEDHSSSTVRNAVILDSNLQNELKQQQKIKQSQQQTQQRVSKNSQKNTDSIISQTLPSRKSMTSINSNYDQINLNDQFVSKKKEVPNSSSSNQNGNHPHHHRASHFSHHFNFPYRIQFTKQNGESRDTEKTSNASSSSSSSTATDNAKYFLYNTNRIKNDFIRNSENLSELNQIKRRSAHLFNL